MGKMEEGNKTFCHSYNTETTHFLLDRSEEKTDKSGTNFLCQTRCRFDVMLEFVKLMGEL